MNLGLLLTFSGPPRKFDQRMQRYLQLQNPCEVLKNFPCTVPRPEAHLAQLYFYIVLEQPMGGYPARLNWGREAGSYLHPDKLNSYPRMRLRARQRTGQPRHKMRQL